MIVTFLWPLSYRNTFYIDLYLHPLRLHNIDTADRRIIMCRSPLARKGP